MGIVTTLLCLLCSCCTFLTCHNLLWLPHQALRKAPGWNNFQLQNAVAFLKRRARKHQIVIIKSDWKIHNPLITNPGDDFSCSFPGEATLPRAGCPGDSHTEAMPFSLAEFCFLDTDELNSELIEVPGLQRWVTALLSCDWWLCYQILINVSSQSLLALSICCPLAPANICLE